ncbi:Spb1 C-terminal domain-containing protein [Xylaria arbuscula]|uniref:AdoMet-dependent rRNA methyltransferase SPB1 n=1 Tax=Xylaria arbuscula TaxID=114810 RepID=A0A9W8N5P8_9PEZI|nr:Spb1 C-terminal domain-containing protein [Xylaria arbuscula]KAJ3558028.1 hypothetical protein NPX13_g9807 [Xylaria arbuscula]
MGFQKKTGKGRLDKYYRLAKEKGYRARAAFKLLQLNKKYDFLGSSRVVIDLCAAPGSWMQVAVEAMPKGSLIVGVDLSPIKPIPGVISFQSDITTDKCRAELRRHLKTWKADTVLHDGAPNVGTAWIQDSFNQAELVLQSLKLAVEFLVEGGTFVTKVFRSAQYNQLLWIFGQLFEKVEATKPPSSRNVSAEIFVVCRGFKAPRHLDPRFLDPKTAFADLKDTKNTDEARVYKPEVKKRKRGGYEEGDYTLYREVPASEFVESTDPISILANTNRLLFSSLEPSLSLAALDKMPATTLEIRQYCADLKVLGRSEFKKLLKWRMVAREAFGLPTKKTSQPATAQEEGEEIAEVESMDDELKLQEDLQALKDKDTRQKKKERKKENLKKQKEIQRIQMHMIAPMEIGIESAQVEKDMFQLRTLEKEKAANQIAKGRMAILSERPKKEALQDDESESEDELNDRLEDELDQHWNAYQERRANYEAKIKRRKQEEDGEWGGLSGTDEEKESSDDDVVEESDDSDSDSDDEGPKPLLTDLDGAGQDAGLSKRATKFFDQDIFKDIPGLEQSDSECQAEEEDEDMDDAPVLGKAEVKPIISEKLTKRASKRNSKEEASPRVDGEEDEDENEDGWENEKKSAGEKPSIDIITAEAMQLAMDLATGKRTTHDLTDEAFDKYAFRDRDGLPEWFLDDEGKHSNKQKPITKAAAQAIKEKTRALNARPIKKVREAQARKKFKTAQRLEKLKKKSDLLANEEGMTEKEKAESIAKLIGKAKKKAPKRSVKVVVARGANRGIQGRPKGVKGRYKIVDSRMKKEMRALKRIAKRK